MNNHAKPVKMEQMYIYEMNDGVWMGSKGGGVGNERDCGRER